MREKLEQLIARVGGPRRAAIIGMGAGAVLLILGLSWWASGPSWVPVHTGIPLESVGEMTTRLDEAKIRHRLEGGGTDLMVPSTELARARVALAQGGLPLAGRPGMELFDQPSWGMTDFTQRINYRRAMEGELQRTIGKMRGIESVQVHLAIQESASFRRADRPTEASVVLKLHGGRTPERDVVNGIQHLVSSSVGGMESTAVMVLDDAGRLLSAPNDRGIGALTNRQLEMRREVEKHLEEKAADLVTQIVGAGNARVQVSAEVNFDRVERTTESVDPDGQVAATEQTSEIVPGAEGGAGSRTSATTYDNSRRMETFSSAGGNVSRVTVAVLVADRPVGTGEETRWEPRAADELTRIQTLVERAVGFDGERGDAVSVVSMPFTAPTPLTRDEPMDVVGVAQQFTRPLLTLIALLLAFVVALRVIRTLRPESEMIVAGGAGATAGAMALPGSAAAGAAGAVPALEPGEARSAEMLPEPLPEEKPRPMLPSTRDKVETLVAERPEVAARLIRSWLQENPV
jgi:flagellar M-ring protein FliF